MRTRPARGMDRLVAFASFWSHGLPHYDSALLGPTQLTSAQRAPYHLINTTYRPQTTTSAQSPTRNHEKVLISSPTLLPPPWLPYISLIPPRSTPPGPS